MTTKLHHGDCLDVMRDMDADSVDTVLTDPPYGLEFMGKDWDHGIPGGRFWSQAWRVSKPGALLLAFGGTRTYHRLTCAIEDAGWQIRDCMMWLYGTGFPKSHNFSAKLNGNSDEWRGWGTALKPAWEPIIVAMKPLDGTFANNAETRGVAGMWIDGGRIKTSDGYTENKVTQGINQAQTSYAPAVVRRTFEPGFGRWPANVILDEDAGAMVDAQNGSGASRFFYCAKASRSERNAGLDGMPGRVNHSTYGEFAGTPAHATNNGAPRANHHPTVKPLKLIEYLARLTKTPTNGIVLDPFMGSGTTGVACVREGREFIGIEKDADYLKIAQARIDHAEAVAIGQTEMVL